MNLPGNEIVLVKYCFYSMLFFLNRLQTLGKNRNVLQLVGYCEDEDVGQVFITEYHKYGSALKFNEILAKNWSLSG